MWSYPLSYFNSRGELVGFDVEMAHRFAERVNLSLEFLPLDRLREGPEKLRAGYCDAVFNSVAVELARIEAAALTDPFSNVTIAFIVPDHRRGEFSTWARVREQGPIQIVTRAFQTLPRVVWSRMPEASVNRLSTVA